MSYQNHKSIYRNISVLVIDDDAVIVQIVEQILKTMGFKDVQVTCFPKTGLDLIVDSFEADKPVDLVICDWMMPELSGIDLLRKIRDKDLKLAFVMLTANATVQAIKDASKLGVDAYIGKPFTADQVQQKIKAVANRILKK